MHKRLQGCLQEQHPDKQPWESVSDILGKVYLRSNLLRILKKQRHTSSWECVHILQYFIA